MSTQTKNPPKGKPTVTQPAGQVFIGPGGDRRIRLGDVRKPSKEDATIVSLADILLNEGVTVELDDNVTIQLPTLTLRTYALITKLAEQDKYKGVDLNIGTTTGDNASNAVQLEFFLDMLTIIANQGRGDDMLSVEQISDAVTVETLPALMALVEEAMRPLQDTKM